MWILAVDHRKAATKTLAALPPGETLRAAETFETALQHAVRRGPGSPVPKPHAKTPHHAVTLLSAGSGG